MARAGARKGQTNPTRVASAGTSAKTEADANAREQEPFETGITEGPQLPSSGSDSYQGDDKTPPSSLQLPDPSGSPERPADASLEPDLPRPPLNERPAAMLNETTAIAPKPDTNPPPPYESSALGPDEPSGSTSEPEAGPTSPNKGGNEPPWHIRRDAILLGLVAGLIGGGLFFAIAHFALERNDPRLAQLQMRVQGMEETLASLDTRLRNLPPDLSGNVATLDNRLDGLDAQVAKLPTSQPDVGPLRKDVSALEENMTALQQSVQGMSGQLSSFDERLTAVQNVVQRGSALQLAVEDAARALREGGSVADPAARLKALANDDAGLAQAADALNSADGKGIVSIASLRQQLDAIEPPTVGEAPAAATGWLGGITANVSKLVDVRGIDTRRDAIRQALDQARIRLADGDLAAARDAVAPLARDQLAGAAAWVAAADNRLQAEQAIASARQRVDAIIGSMR